MIGVIVLGLVIFAIFAPGNHASVSSNSSATATATATTPAKPKLTIANIATTPFSYDPIDAPGMIGSFDRFDPIVNLEWVRSIGRAWRADAVFYRLDIDRVARDGLIDVKNIPNAQAMYRFVSPKCASDKAASTAVVVSKVRCGLNILVMRQEGSAAPEVIADAVDGDASNPPELPSPACTLAKAFAAVDKAGKLPAKPVFNVWILGATNRARGTGPEWIIGDIQGASIARVDATSCVLR